MSKTTARTGTAPFAHLLSLVTGKTAASKRAEEERREEEAEDEKDDADAEDEETDEQAEDGKPNGSAEDDSDEMAEDDDEDVDAEEDDSEKEAKAHAAGFAAAQARGRKIFGSASAALRPDMAAHLAFNESMSAKKAVEMLDLAAAGGAPAPAAQGSRLHRRMAKVVTPNPGTGGPNGAGNAAKGEVDDFVAMATAAAKKAGIA